MRHIIKKQVVDVSIRNKKEAYRLQQLISDRYRRNITIVLQKAFDKVSREDEVICIDRLEIDLGLITEKEIEKGTWESIIFKIVTEQFDRLKQKTSPEKIIKQQSAITSFVEQWLFYMRKGYLPWNATRFDEGWYQNILHALATDFNLISELRLLIGNDAHSLKRIAFQHREPFLVPLAESLTAESQKLLPGVLNEIIELLLFFRKEADEVEQINKKYLRRQLWIQVLRYAAVQRGKKSTEGIALHLLEVNLVTMQSKVRIPRRFFTADRIIASDIRLWRENRKRSKEQKQYRKKDSIEQKKQTQSTREDLILSPDLRTSESKEKKNILIDTGGFTDDSKSTSNEQSNYPDEFQEEIFVQTAGIVLLHPFLRTFFNKLELLKEDEFISFYHHQKALDLLYYLATGRVTAAEHELVSAKIICGYPLHRPVLEIIDLSVAEISEADQLLIEVVRQWEVLKNSSPDALREGFLQRSGKFFSKNDMVYLQVESGSIDVLLDYLPWNLSIVQLPWMNRVLRVEWR
jgi:hypothetical protein